MKVDFNKLDRAFNPKCVVVVGDKKDNEYRWLRAQAHYKGKFYSVQIDPSEIPGIEALGIKNYKSLMDIPEPVDFVIVAVPRNVAPRILEDCIRKDVAAAHFYTSGFAETDTEEGKKLQKIMTERAEQANFHMIGPNCMGLFNPRVGIMQGVDQYLSDTGKVGFISQSGNHAISFAQEAHLEGIDVCKSASFGNGLVLDSPDYLEYFARDPEIKIIGMYLEGTRNGPRFLKVLKEVAAKKPVVIWKGGRTEAGGRAISSHTGSLAVAQSIFEAAARQCGVVTVTSVEELIDTLKALLFLSPVYGDRVAMAGGSGGQSVAIADVFNEAGLKVPTLTQESYIELSTFFSLIGGGCRNPIDTGNPNRRQMHRIMEILERDSNIDNLVLLVSTRFGTPEQLDISISSATDIKQKTNKPVMSIVFWSFAPEEIVKANTIVQKLQDNGIPAFISLERGAKALKNAFTYYQLRNGN